MYQQNRPILRKVRGTPIGQYTPKWQRCMTKGCSKIDSKTLMARQQEGEPRSLSIGPTYALKVYETVILRYHSWKSKSQIEHDYPQDRAHLSSWDITNARRLHNFTQEFSRKRSRVGAVEVFQKSRTTKGDLRAVPELSREEHTTPLSAGHFRQKTIPDENPSGGRRCRHEGANWVLLVGGAGSAGGAQVVEGGVGNRAASGAGGGTVGGVGLAG